jgi:hypothetical protein
MAVEAPQDSARLGPFGSWLCQKSFKNMILCGIERWLTRIRSVMFAIALSLQSSQSAHR